ncbi:TerD family protein [Salibacteraceae bacterium]|nr:TerD family protein [Salibacteraceae bacterium]
MGFNLSKGSSFNLTKEVPSLKVAGIGLGWNTGADLDVSAFCLAADGHIFDESGFVFYGSNFKQVLEGEEGPRPYSSDGGVYGAIDELEGDEDDSEEDGDLENMMVYFDRVSEEVKEIIVVVTIYEGAENFGGVTSYCRIWDESTEKELCRYTLNDEFQTSDSIEVGKFHRDGDGWSFTALGNGRNGGVQGFIKKYAYRI